MDDKVTRHEKMAGVWIDGQPFANIGQAVKNMCLFCPDVLERDADSIGRFVCCYLDIWRKT